MSFELPAPKEIRDLLDDLMGRPITVDTANPVLAADLPTSTVCLYTDDRMKLVGVIGLDLPLTVYAGAAIGLLPPGGAQDCVADRVVPGPAADNIREVANILASLINRPGSPHVRLHQVVLPGEPAPTDAAGLLLAIGRRIDLAVTVGGYGSGRLSLSLSP